MEKVTTLICLFSKCSCKWSKHSHLLIWQKHILYSLENTNPIWRKVIHFPWKTVILAYIKIALLTILIKNQLINIFRRTKALSFLFRSNAQEESCSVVYLRKQILFLLKRTSTPFRETLPDFLWTTICGLPYTIVLPIFLIKATFS